MADANEAKTSSPPETEKKKSKFPLIVMGLVLVVALAIGYVLMTIKSESAASVKEEKSKAMAEYVVAQRMYQLKDGSYLRLGFSIVVEADQLPMVKELIEKTAPSRLPDGIHMLLGNKSRENLIDGTYQREAFTRELKKMINDQVFAPYNKEVATPDQMLEAKDVLLAEYVTQSG